MSIEYIGLDPDFHRDDKQEEQVARGKKYIYKWSILRI